MPDTPFTNRELKAMFDNLESKIESFIELHNNISARVRRIEIAFLITVGVLFTLSFLHTAGILDIQSLFGAEPVINVVITPEELSEAGYE